MDDANEFTAEPPTKVENVYYAIGEEADRQRQRASEQALVDAATLARGTREWGRK